MLNTDPSKHVFLEFFSIQFNILYTQLVNHIDNLKKDFGTVLLYDF